jgi:Uma2 family endonuclease
MGTQGIMTVKIKPMTYVEFIAVSEGSDLEFIDGEIVEMLPARTSNSEIHDRLVFLVRLHYRDHKIPCHTASADGTFKIMGDVVVPDFAYKPTPMSNDYPDATPPTWVAEIISPTDKKVDIERKRAVYLKAGILLLEIHHQIAAVDVCTLGQTQPRHHRVGDVIDLDSVLRAFKLPVRDLFE